ncbi:MAG: hypothetical protein HYR98_07805 [Nitrospirae bacterium]|nr:hypothetical protein [Nitrospirota bacterium]
MMRWMGVIAVSAGLVFFQGCGKKEEDKKITIEFNVKKEEPQAPEKAEEKKVASAPAPTVSPGPAPLPPPAVQPPAAPPPKTEAREIPPPPAAPPKAEPRPEKKKEEGRIAAIEPRRSPGRL